MIHAIKQVAELYNLSYIGKYVEEETEYLCYGMVSDESPAVLLRQTPLDISILQAFPYEEADVDYYVYQYCDAIRDMKHMLGKRQSLSDLKEILSYLMQIDFPRIEYMSFSWAMLKEHEECIRETAERIKLLEEQGKFMRAAFCYKETRVFALVPDVVTMIWEKLQE
jgi:hypothetical protein